MHCPEEHRALQHTVEQFVINELNPYVDDWEKSGAFPAHEVFKKMGELGLLGINKPERFGGMGLNFHCALMVAEALGACHSIAISLAIGAQTDFVTPTLARFGSDELREAFLTPAVNGESVAALAIQERNVGSNIAELSTQAKRTNTIYRLNGEKVWVANATQADYFCVMANTAEGDPLFNKSLILVPRHLPGVSVGTPIQKLGANALGIAPVYFDDVSVPVTYRIGAENQGFPMQMIQFQEEHLSMCARALLSLERCLELTIEHRRKRHSFSQTQNDHRHFSFQIAEMKTEVELLRSLIYRACADYMVGKDAMHMAAMATLKVHHVMRTIADTCLQFWGTDGLAWDCPISQCNRDWRLFSLNGSTPEMMLNMICNTLNFFPPNDNALET